jgi:phage shock protein A
MGKQSIFGRVAQLAKANIHSLLDSAEDPEKMLDQMVRDYTNNIAEAEQAIAQTIGSVRMLEEDFQADQEAAADWGQKAQAASTKADEFAGMGDTADAEKFNNLAKVAIERQMDIEGDLKIQEPNLRAQQDVVDKLKSGLDSMKAKLNELTTKRDELIARAKTAEATSHVQDSLKSIDILDPTSELGRFEDKIRREEAKVRGQAELATSSLDSQFEQLESAGDNAEVEARLAMLKSGSGAGAPQLSGGSDFGAGSDY